VRGVEEVSEISEVEEVQYIEDILRNKHRFACRRQYGRVAQAVKESHGLLEVGP
jgi:hypothetical protein